MTPDATSWPLPGCNRCAKLSVDPGNLYYDNRLRLLSEHPKAIDSQPLHFKSDARCCTGTAQDRPRPQYLGGETILYETTNFFTFLVTFDARSEMAQRGTNKQTRQDLRQLSLALFEDRDRGLALYLQCYAGNRKDVTHSPFAGEGFLTQWLGALGREAGQLTLAFDRGSPSDRKLRRWSTREHLREFLEAELTTKDGKVTGLEWSWNLERKREVQRRHLGRQLLVTSRLDWDSVSIVRVYRRLTRTEDLFRISKSRPGVWWPPFHWTDSKIRVHALYCVPAPVLLAILRLQLAEQMGTTVSEQH